MREVAGVVYTLNAVLPESIPYPQFVPQTAILYIDPVEMQEWASFGPLYEEFS
jgi:hypothetical protein